MLFIFGCTTRSPVLVLHLIYLLCQLFLHWYNKTLLLFPVKCLYKLALWRFSVTVRTPMLHEWGPWFIIQWQFIDIKMAHLFWWHIIDEECSEIFLSLTHTHRNRQRQNVWISLNYHSSDNLKQLTSEISEVMEHR